MLFFHPVVSVSKSDASVAGRHWQIHYTGRSLTPTFILSMILWSANAGKKPTETHGDRKMSCNVIHRFLASKCRGVKPYLLNADKASHHHQKNKRKTLRYWINILTNLMSPHLVELNLNYTLWWANSVVVDGAQNRIPIEVVTLGKLVYRVVPEIFHDVIYLSSLWAYHSSEYRLRQKTRVLH